MVAGARYQHFWQTFARQSWERYAQRHGYTLLVLDQPIDRSPLASQRSLAWQKLLVLTLPDVQRFDQVVWIDADVIINDALAPCIVRDVPVERIGAVRDQFLLSHPSLASSFSSNNKWAGTPTELFRLFYRLNNLTPEFDCWLQTGVLVLSPRHHRQVLEYVYYNHRETPQSYYEEIGLSHEVLRRDLFHPIDSRFNSLWLEYKVGFYPFTFNLRSLLPLCLTAAMNNSFFLHFAGLMDDASARNPSVQISEQSGVAMPIPLIDQISGEWQALARQARQQPTS
jgi:hypothetical protein